MEHVVSCSICYVHIYIIGNKISVWYVVSKLEWTYYGCRRMGTLIRLI